MTEKSRKYQVIVFGASGVTGEYVVEELANNHPDIIWCVAGRNKDKLKATLKEVGDTLHKNLDEIDILEADVSNGESIAAMCKNATVLVNCVGPYRFSGEQIVEQCVKHSTNYVDVSGEPQFLETIQMKYYHEAKEKGIFIVGSCGFDSIPCDMGVEMIRKKFNGDLNSVETYLSTNQPPETTVNFGTWQSAIHGLAHAHELKPLRQALKAKVFTKDWPKPKYRLKPRGNLFNSEVADGWCIPFIGSDRSVILRTQMHNYEFKNERPIQVQTYMKPKSLIAALATLLCGIVFMFNVRFSIGRYLLEKFPELFSFGVFSRTPPKKELSSSGSFSVTFNAQGWNEKLSDPTDNHQQPPNKTVKAVMKGPDPGYITTAICLVNSAVVILEERGRLPEHGGVFTPASAFSNTSLMDRLEKRGITLTMSVD